MTDTIQWTLRGYKPSLIASPWFWVKHFNIIFLEPIGWMSANHLLVGLSSSLHFGGSWTTSVVQSTTVRILFLHVLIHGSLWHRHYRVWVVVEGPFSFWQTWLAWEYPTSEVVSHQSSSRLFWVLKSLLLLLSITAARAQRLMQQHNSLAVIYLSNNRLLTSDYNVTIGCLTSRD